MRLVNGNLLDTEIKLIAHGVNCADVFETGVAGSFKERYPFVKTAYHEFVRDNGGPGSHLLGKASTVYLRDITVFNCFTQERYGYDGHVYASYTAIVQALMEMRGYIKRHEVKEVAIPKIGCGRGGLEWGIVRELLLDLERQLNVEFVVYELTE